MKISSGLVIAFCYFLSPVQANVKINKDQFLATKDYIGNSMWLMGKNGVFIYSPDGKDKKVSIDGSAICHEEPDFKGSGYYSPCRFYDVMSDGKKYVWASLARGVAKIDLFDINTGAVVGSFDTCMSPSSLEFHPLRDEVWVRCSDMDANSTAPTQLDVFSASSPSGVIQTDILTDERALKEGLSSKGYSVIDNTLGDVGFITDTTLPYLFKVDLSTKAIIDKFEMNPPTNGLEKTAYSPVNKHIFIRSELCCTCGFEGSDLGDSCGRYPGSEVSPVTGAFAGETGVQGTCGSSCEGKPDIDTIGVYEFDTGNETIVATHLMAEGIGGDPYPSPDGKYIILLGRNGGKTIRIIEAGEPGRPSTKVFDVELDFNRSGYEDKSVSMDFAFVKKNGNTNIIFPSGTEHKIAIVDITSDPMETRYFTFNDDDFIPGRAPHGRYRRIEWAIGTNYVWVTDSSLDETYVIDFVKEEVVTTLTDTDVSKLLSVQNYEYLRQFEMQKQVVMGMTRGVSDNGKDSSALEVSAIVLGTIAIVVGIANYIYMMKMRKLFIESQASPDEPIALVKNLEQPLDDDSAVVPSVN